MSEKANYTFNLWRWQHTALKSVATEYKTSMKQLVLGSVVNGMDYGFDAYPVVPGRERNKVNLTVDADILNSLREEAVALNMDLAEVFRSKMFKDRAEAGKLPYACPIRTPKGTIYDWLSPTEGEYRAIRKYADRNGMPMAEVVRDGFDGKLPPLLAEQVEGVHRGKSIGIRILASRKAELMEESIRAGMQFNTYRRSLLFPALRPA